MNRQSQQLVKTTSVILQMMFITNKYKKCSCTKVVIVRCATDWIYIYNNNKKNKEEIIL